MRCLTITLNAAVDTTYVLERYRHGATQRVGRKISTPGGKGNNVARVLTALGNSVVATGFVAGDAGRFIAQGLRDSGVETAFLDVPGESRTCLAIRETESGTITELLEPGVVIAADDADRFMQHVVALASGVEVVAISGSLPAGLPTDYYAHLIGSLRALPVRICFDASGVAFRSGLAAQPDSIKPNRAEIAELIGETACVQATVAAARSALIGPVLAADATILLSLGAGGAVLVRREVAFIATPPRVAVMNTVGAGDATVAGYLDAVAAGADAAEALVSAVAVGTATTLHEMAGVVDVADIARIRAAVRVAPLA